MGDVLVSPRAWWIASAVGLPVAIPVGLAAGAPLEVVVGMVLVTPVMHGVVGGLLGASQWLVLRRHLEQAWWWIVTSAVGLGLGLTAGVVIVEQGGAMLTGAPMRLATTGTVGLVLSMLVIGGVGGSFGGLTQWLYLRRHTRATPVWALHTALALSGGLILGLVAATTLFGGITSPAGLISFLATAGVVYGGLTSRALPVPVDGSRTQAPG